MQLSGISVVIPAYNEEKYLPNTLAMVSAARSQVDFPVEVIVVDNASTDRTGQIAEANGARVVRHDVRNISSVRNVGIREARYDMIVSIDADCGTPVDAFQKISQFMSSDDYIGGGLGLRLLSDKFVTQMMVGLIQFLVGKISGIQGAVFFFLRADALAVGGFDESRLVAEDSIFAIAMQKYARARGKKFGLLKSVKITTIDRKDTSLATLGPLAFKLLRVFFGHKLTQKDLGYWYDPKR
jgi:glycosyltransferase involved in cell wall biosynthesis